MIPKFRAWNKTYKEMGVVKRIRFDDEGNVATVLIRNRAFGSNAYPKDLVLMQSTGLLDKSGKEIFEGDILKNNKYITSVFYEDGAYCVKFRRTPNTTVIMNVISFIKKYKTRIVGNIYETPELLEVEGWKK